VVNLGPRMKEMAIDVNAGEGIFEALPQLTLQVMQPK
jgi:hypothetical protein